MPTVPLYDGPKVAPAARPDVRSDQHFSAADFGGAVAQGVQDLGASLQERARAQQALDDQQATADAHQAVTAYSLKQSEITYGKDGQGGVFNAQGADAAPAAQSGADQLRQARNDAGANLSGRAREIYDRLSGEQIVQDTQLLNRHAALGNLQVAEMGWKGQEAMATRTAMEHRGDPTIVQKSVEDTLGAIQGRYALHGLAGSPAMHEEMNAKVDQIHTNNLDGMIKTGSVGPAQAYFDKFGPDMSQGAKDDARKALQNASRLGEAQGLATDAATAHPDDLAGALAQVKEKAKDPFVQEAAVRQVVENQRQTNEAAQQKDDQAREAFALRLRQGESLDTIQMDPGWLKLKENTRLSLESSWKRQTGIAADKLTPENAAATDNIRRLINLGTVADKDGFSRPMTTNDVNDLIAAHHLTGEQATSVLAYKNEGGNKKGFNQELVDRVVSMVTGKQGDDLHKEVANGWYNYLRARIPPDQVPNEDNLHQIAVNAVAKGTAPGSGFFSDSMRQIDASTAGREWLPTIPDAEVDHFAKVFKAMPGVQIAPDGVNLRRFYGYSTGLTYVPFKYQNALFDANNDPDPKMRNQRVAAVYAAAANDGVTTHTPVSVGLSARLSGTPIGGAAMVGGKLYGAASSLAKTIADGLVEASGNEANNLRNGRK